MKTDFTLAFTPYLTRFNQKLSATLPETNSVLHQAMRYSILNGGKRIRPLLVYATGMDFGANEAQLVQAAVAIELIHGYSLIHDDLPAMDDDSLRRGQATCHKQFDEATAILAGDALNTLAFNILTRTTDNPSTNITLIQQLTHAAGPEKMILGQSMDLAAENQNIDLAQLKQLHQLKTGALIRCAIEMGATIANTTTATINTLNQLGETLGLAFQLQDDLLDVESTTDQLGKKTGADQKHNKATFPSLLGITESHRLLENLQTTLREHLNRLPASPLLSSLINDILQRPF